MPRPSRIDQLGLIGISEVAKLVGISKPTLRKMIAAGKFPAPVDRGPNVLRMWRVDTIQRYMKTLKI